MPIDKGLLKRRKIPDMMVDYPIAGDVSQGQQPGAGSAEAGMVALVKDLMDEASMYEPSLMGSDEEPRELEDEEMDVLIEALHRELT